MKGLYFTSSLVSIRYIAVLGFQLLVGNLHDEAGRSFLSAISRYLVSNVQDVQVFLWDRYVFPSAISRYLVSNGRINIQVSLGTLGFPSAISRYLVSNFGDGYIISCANGSFHPLYRGTWFPTSEMGTSSVAQTGVSIRYIAVLGFQLRATIPFFRIFTRSFHPLYRGTWFPTLPEKHPL